jgi:hypothetical protein
MNRGKREMNSFWPKNQERLHKDGDIYIETVRTNSSSPGRELLGEHSGKN